MPLMPPPEYLALTPEQLKESIQRYYELADLTPIEVYNELKKIATQIDGHLSCLKVTIAACHACSTRMTNETGTD